MDMVHDDRFMVFVRSDSAEAKSTADAVETPLATCASYSEALRIREALRARGAGECVIRYFGPAGGGD
jgi:hypothetical protein